MTSKYTAAKLAAIARETAVKVGCQAVHWWQEEGDPSRLYIEAKPLLLSHRALLVQLAAVLPKQPENGAKDGQSSEEVALPVKAVLP
ncbi:MAG TPA: hypothetical protein VGX03_08690 [Candidatus Binatia bacterium]|nr:hypothetical protein [Candidatus Binatia bacterium]